MELQWSGGYGFAELLGSQELHDQFSCPGVYVQTDHRPGVAYVGKASGSPGLWERQYQHYLYTIGGHYKVPAAVTDLDARYAWDPSQPGKLDILFSREKFKNIVELAFDYVPKITIHLCPLASHADAKIAERELLWALQPLDNHRGTKTPPNQENRFVHYCGNFSGLSTLFKRERRNNSFVPTGSPL